MSDSTISKIRMIRKEISANCENDPKKLVEYYMKLQKNYKGPVYEEEKIKEKLIKTYDEQKLGNLQ